MALGSQPRWTVRPAAGVQVDIDVGLRDYMLRIYNYMASGLALTGIVAYVFAQSGYYAQLAQTPLIYLVMLAPLGLVMWLSYGVNRMQASTAQALFWIFASVMGLSMASIIAVISANWAGTSRTMSVLVRGSGVAWPFLVSTCNRIGPCWSLTSRSQFRKVGRSWPSTGPM